MGALGPLLTLDKCLLVKLFTHCLVVWILMIARFCEMTGKKELIPDLKVTIDNELCLWYYCGYT